MSYTKRYLEEIMFFFDHLPECVCQECDPELNLEMQEEMEIN